MNLLILSTFVILCILAIESRYPYDDAYSTGDIVPPRLNTRYGYDRDRVGKYPAGKLAGGGYGTGSYDRRNSRYGGTRDVQHRDYTRRSRDYGSYLRPRGIGGGYSRHHDRPGYEYGRNRPHINGPPKYYDDDEINYGGYKKITGIGNRYH